MCQRTAAVPILPCILVMGAQNRHASDNLAICNRNPFQASIANPICMWCLFMTGVG